MLCCSTDAFTQLRKQILDLAVEHFKGLRQEPPEHVRKRVPQNIPPFYTNTEASTELRAAYIEHIVSRALTERIFQPFLFTLSRRHESADALFQTMSDKLRHKSIRREAIWRQHTLHAAYTVSSAKQSINKVAAVIVEEILGELEHFANPSQMEHITVAVRRIVKIAAETWRYVRLEREMITATMAAAEHPDRFDSASGNEDLSQRAPPEVLLPVLPFIEREPAHESLRSAANRNDTGCVYSRGVALLSDSPVILARLAELGENQPEARQTQDAAMEEPGTPRGPDDQPILNPMPPLSPLFIPITNPEKQPEAEKAAVEFEAEAMSTGETRKSSVTGATEGADQSSQTETQSVKEAGTPRSSTSGRQSPLTVNSSSAEIPNWGMARNTAGW